MIEEEEIFNDDDDIWEPKLPLDTDLVRWYMERMNHYRISSERLAEYHTEIWSRLRNNFRQTTKFLEDCTDAELDALSDIISDLCYDFKSDLSEKDYKQFIECLQELAEDRPKTDLKKD